MANFVGRVPGATSAITSLHGEFNADGISDIISNEVLGDGSSAQDVGNLLLIDGKVLFRGQTLHADGIEYPPSGCMRKFRSSS